MENMEHEPVIYSNQAELPIQPQNLQPTIYPALDVLGQWKHSTSGNALPGQFEAQATEREPMPDTT